MTGVPPLNFKQLCWRAALDPFSASWLLPAGHSLRRGLRESEAWRAQLSVDERLLFDFPLLPPGLYRNALSLPEHCWLMVVTLAAHTAWCLVALLRAFSRRVAARMPAAVGPAVPGLRPGIAVVLVSWNGLPLLQAALASLRRQTRRPEAIIVVDNGSTDGTAAWLAAQHPDIRCVGLGGNTGFARAANAGLRLVQHEWTLLLNNDIELADGFLVHLAAAADAAAAETGILAPQIRFHTDRERLNALGDRLYRSFIPGHNCYRVAAADAPAVSEPITSACAAAVMYRTAMLRNIGYFDEQFVMTYEDSDLAWRAGRAGYVCRTVPAAVAYHHRGATIGLNTPVNVYFTLKNKGNLWLKNAGRADLLRCLPALLVHHTWLVWRLARQQPLAAALGVHAAWQDLGVMMRQRRETPWPLATPFSLVPLRGDGPTN